MNTSCIVPANTGNRPLHHRQNWQDLPESGNRLPAAN
jgi:hypothetical protein